MGERSRVPWWGVAAAVVLWFGFWYLTPGLHSNGLGLLFTGDEDLALLIEIVVAALVAVGLLLTHRRYNRVLFARSRMMWLYLLPLALVIVLPFHYEMPVPIVLYIVWWIVSVFWQNYLSFGLLHGYLSERLPTWAVIVASAVLFWLGHVLLVSHRFALENLVPSLAILALGLVLASLRAWLKTLHLNLALHLSFYYVFA